MISFDRNTPVLLIVYNRPNTTEKVLERIREARPKRLYVAADAPKCDADIEECTKVQSLFDDLGTDIHVCKKYQSVNLGCDAHCYAAISWFFEQEPEGIILEDDCVPSLSFFGFCSTLLERYRNDERIGHIAGSNYQFGKKRGDGSYYFSNLTHVGGWAGWKRVWNDHKTRLENYEKFCELGYLSYLPSHAPFRFHWNRFYVLANQSDNNMCWDYKYAYSNLRNNRLSIIPNVNLVCNIGCYDNPTHLVNDYPFANIPCCEIEKEELVHPSFICPDIEADLRSQATEYSISYETHFTEEDSIYLKDRLNSYSKSEQLLIPKIIHQVYEDLSGPPMHLREIAQSWQEKNPSWEYRFWNKNDIDLFLEQEFPEFKSIYYAFPYPVQRWDAIRYLILYRYGGLYVDMDYECTEPIVPLLNGISCAIGLEPKAHAVRSHMPYIVGNAFMAAIPHHPFLKELVSNVFQPMSDVAYKSKGEAVLQTTGPYKVTALYKQSKYQDQITLVPAALVAPLAQEEVYMILNDQISMEIENKVEKSYAIHYFFGSWY